MWRLAYHSQATDAQCKVQAEAALAQLRARSEIGFLQLPMREGLWRTAQQRAREARRQGHSLVVFGVGGSSLGGRTLLETLHKWDSVPTVEFVDNIDAHRFSQWLKNKRDIPKTHWAIVSKTGNTMETLALAEFTDQFLRSSGYKRLASQCTVISEPKDNPLVQWAKREGVACLELPVYVGGRFSVLTPVGVFPAAFYEADVEAIRVGAEWALRQDQLITELVAQSLQSWQRGEWVTMFWAYSDAFREAGLWLQQLWSESLGKAKRRDGGVAPRVSVPMPCTGIADQHSILQQVMEGQKDKFVWFIRVDESEQNGTALENNLFSSQDFMRGRTMGQLLAAEAQATQEGMLQAGVPSLTLHAERLDAWHVGAYFMLMQLVVGALGEALDVNAFDQPGVELGKRLAREILRK